MGRVIIAGLWTTGAVLGCVLVLGDAEAVAREPQRLAILLLPVIGAALLWDVARRLRRRRSLRQVTEDGGTVWVWIDLDGSLARSTTDPTPGWDAADGGDGDGDGDGGD